MLKILLYSILSEATIRLFHFLAFRGPCNYFFSTLPSHSHSQFRYQTSSRPHRKEDGVLRVCDRLVQTELIFKLLLSFFRLRKPYILLPQSFTWVWTMFNCKLRLKFNLYLHLSFKRAFAHMRYTISFSLNIKLLTHLSYFISLVFTKLPISR